VDDRDVENLATALATKRVLFTPTFHRSEDHVTVPEGMKRVAIAAQDIEAYQRMEETAWQGNRRRPMWRLVRVEDARFSQALEAHEIAGFYGRVLLRAKRRGDFLTRGDFLPAGTLPGVAAAAGVGRTVFAIADKEIEGVDSFQTDDRVAILIRGVVKPISGVTVHGLNLQRPVSSVIVPEARIARASRGGQTVLEVKNEDLTRLQAAWAASMSRGEQQAEGSDKPRSHLLAVALPRNTAKPIDGQVAMFQQESGGQIAIAPFDPIGEVKIVETIIGKQREMHAFAGSSSDGQQQSVPLTFAAQ
jgi:hypothetical protein